MLHFKSLLVLSFTSIGLAIWPSYFTRYNSMVHSGTNLDEFFLTKIKASIVRMGRLVNVKRCYPQALAFAMLARYYGYGAIVKIGRNLFDAQADSFHAWVEINGRVVFGAIKGLENYNVFEIQP